MSRGARRRSGRGGRRRGVKPGSGPRDPGTGDHLKTKSPQAESSGRSRRRRRGGPARAGLSEILDNMAARPGSLQTLPPDGIVLEEVIAGLEQEYGVPATPQEYRLIIKVASREESQSAPEDPSKRRDDQSDGVQASPRRRRRGNRRQSRRKGPAAKTETPG